MRPAAAWPGNLVAGGGRRVGRGAAAEQDPGEGTARVEQLVEGGAHVAVGDPERGARVISLGGLGCLGRVQGGAASRDIDNADHRANDLVVTDGLEAGELVASAGVSYLVDGQKVKPLPVQE